MVYRLSSVTQNVSKFSQKKGFLMIRFNARTQSVVLACAMVFAANSSCAQSSNPFAGIGSYFSNATVLSATVATLLALKVRLDTKPRGTYSYDDWQDDIIGLLGSYNIFSAASRATILNFIDKYFVGSKFKVDEQTIKVKEDNGTVVATKRKKASQKPSGAMGLFDAYVFQQLEGNNKLLPELVAMYLLIMVPKDTWNKVIKKIMGETYVVVL
jgi:hypothetical protein